MKISNIYKEIALAQRDEHANIKLVKLTGDENLSVFAAEVSPNSALNPHFHKHGIETYQILQGQGTMKVGNWDNNSLSWENSYLAEVGDTFSIPEGKVHQIVNESESSLLVVFSGPESHLSTDRYFCN